MKTHHVIDAVPAGSGRTPPTQTNPWLFFVLSSVLLCGCSLLTIKSPEIPLTPREQEMRALTRDYAAHFTTTVTRLFDGATLASDDPGMRARALRLKVGAVTEITRASTGLSPTASLLDTWAFAVQFEDFLHSGAGAHAMGAGQAGIDLGAARLAAEADELARRVAGDDYARYQAFVIDYAGHHPLEDAQMARPSVLSAWIAGTNDKSAVRADGTVAQALGDVSDRIRIYGERVPTLGLWETQLALDRAGFDQSSYRTALHNLDVQLERISRLAEISPRLAHDAITELRGSLRESTDRLDASWLQTLKTLRIEREALALDLAAEREGITAAFDQERTRITTDAAKIAADTVDTSWRELRKLIREALLLSILVAVVMLGLPFAAGYVAGRRRDRISVPPSDGG